MNREAILGILLKVLEFEDARELGVILTSLLLPVLIFIVKLIIIIEINLLLAIIVVASLGEIAFAFLLILSLLESDFTIGS